VREGRKERERSGAGRQGAAEGRGCVSAAWLVRFARTPAISKSVTAKALALGAARGAPAILGRLRGAPDG